jgi:hypothetical protein
MTVANPKFTGVAAVLNRIAAKAATKATVMPLISMKERVEKVLAEYVSERRRERSESKRGHCKAVQGS